MKLEKKINSLEFARIKDGDQTFDIRLTDFEANQGDMLVLREWDKEEKKYTGRSMECIIGSTVKLSDIEDRFLPEERALHGYQILSLRPVGMGSGHDRKRLYRDIKNKYVTGLLAGLAEYLDLDPSIIRIAYILLTVFTGVAPGVIGYILASLVIPKR